MPQILKYFTIISLCSLSATLTSCQTIPYKVRTSPPDINADIDDPFETVNRQVYKFNEIADRFLIKPVTKVYTTLMPKPLRQGLNNASRNLGEPIIFANEILQLDFEDASDSLGRFVVNSTVGLGGVIDVAEKSGKSQKREDFGQTLATYEVPSGPYIVLPLLGPSNTRDIVGRIGDGLSNPLSWLDFDERQTVRIGQQVSNGLNTRERAEPFLENIRNSADSYISLRGVYTQDRLVNIHEDSDDFDGFADIDESGDVQATDDEVDDFNDGFADFE